VIKNESFERSIVELAAGLAHEVRNPLSLVSANIDLLELNDDRPAHAKNYRVMRRELTRVNDMLTDFMGLAKPIDNVCPAVSISVPRLLREIVDDLRPAMHGISLYLESEDLAPCISADAEALRRLFVNLIKNAAESISLTGRVDGEIVIEVHSGGGAIVTISDNGMGADDDTISRMSLPFFTTKPDGTGLGLYLAGHIIDAHNGELTFERTEGGGLCVTVALPRTVESCYMLRSAK